VTANSEAIAGLVAGNGIVVTNFTIVGHSEAEKPLFRILCANCVPDSEDTVRKNGQSDSRPISHLDPIGS
jgi:hypothetical protein